jgi:PKD repeat protein
LSLNTSGGLISGAVTSSAGVYTVTLSATNGAGTGTQSFTLNVTNPVPPAPAITSASSGSAVIGSAFSHQVTASNTPTSFGASGLPSGLSINTGSGLISGTVSTLATAGVYSVNLTASNAGGTGAQTFSLTLANPLPPAPVITSANSTRAVLGVDFSFQVTASNSPTTYAASGLPAGLAINSSTGLITGNVPTSLAAGSYTATLTATNAGGSGTQTITFDVKSAFSAWGQDRSIADVNAVSNTDSDGDGLVTLMEYAFNRSPTSAESTPVSEVSVANDNGTRRLEISFVRPNNRPDLVYRVEVSSDLQNWSSGHGYGAGISNAAVTSTQEVERVSLGASGERVRVRDIGGSGRRFIRVKVSTQ